MRVPPGKTRVKPKPAPKPKPRLKRPYRSWPDGERRMVSFPVQIPFASPRARYKEADVSGKSALLRFVSRGKTKRWVIALVERRDLHKFVLLKKAVAPYSQQNPGERVLRLLATKEFGLNWPAELVIIRDSAVAEQLVKQLEKK